MNLFLFLFIGLIAGWLSGRITRGSGYGLTGNVVVGSIGALLGGYIFEKLGVIAPGNFGGSLVTALFGAVTILFIFGRGFRRA